MVARLGRGIAALRSKCRLTRKGLASRVEISYSQLGYWERGLSQPPIRKLVALTRILGVSIEELIAAGGPAEEGRVWESSASSMEPSPHQAG
jgi:transcriptional regulator with XRE-family HTH domain